MLKKVTHQGMHRPELVLFRQHWLDGDYGVVLLSGWLTDESDTATGRPIRPVVDHHVADEGRSRVHWEVGHVVFFLTEGFGEDGVFLVAFWLRGWRL